MKKLFVGLLVLTSAAFAQAEADVNAGKAVAAQCAACHGADGNSSGGANPSLAGQNAKYLAKQLMDMKSGARNVAMMSGIVSGLSEQDIVNVSAYFASQTITGGAADPELVAKGEEVYRAGNLETGVSACTGCHGPDGSGNKGAGYPSLAGQHASYIEAQLKAFRLGAHEPKADGARTNDGDDQQTMRTVAAQMSDLEIRAVASFIQGLRGE